MPGEDKMHSWHMPAEWEQHLQTWMDWPERLDNWRHDAKPAQEAYCRVAEAISQFEHVTVCASTAQWQNARAKLPPHIRVVEMTFNDAWVRDTGPTFVVSEQLGKGRRVGGVHWRFNGYGNKYTDFDQDALAAAKICDLERVPCDTVDMVLEGGSIHVDGEGTLISTEECLLESGRNPGLSREQIEQQLRSKLGVRKIIWIPKGLYMDMDTNGHIDNLAFFARPGVVVLSWTDDQSDPQYERSAQALKVLESSTDCQGRPIQVVKLQLPSPLYRTEEECEGLQLPKGVLARKPGERLAGSYANCYICNGGVLVPAFGDKEADDRAVKVLQEVFPDRKVVSVHTREVLLGGGNIHCITCQQPLAGSTSTTTQQQVRAVQ